MDYSWMVKYITEFIGTALLIILGNGAVANVELKGTKASGQSWLIIAWGYGLGVMLPALALGNVSAQINPAFTLGLAASGLFPWAQVLPYIIAQVLGAMFGQLIVVMVYRPYYLKTEKSNAILGTFSTIDNVDDGTITTHTGAVINGFLNEFVGSFVLFFGAMGLTSPAVAKGVGVMGLGFLVLVLVASLGGPSGPALNPARDFGPRLVHFLLPKSILGEHKADSKWWYSWVPVLAPILAALTAVALYKMLYIK